MSLARVIFKRQRCERSDERELGGGYVLLACMRVYKVYERGINSVVVRWSCAINFLVGIPNRESARARLQQGARSRSGKWDAIRWRTTPWHAERYRSWPTSRPGHPVYEQRLNSAFMAKKSLASVVLWWRTFEDIRWTNSRYFYGNNLWNTWDKYTEKTRFRNGHRAWIIIVKCSGGIASISSYY